MLSLQTLTSAQGALDYYSSTYTYYQDNITRQHQAICWQGKGAAHLDMATKRPRPGADDRKLTGTVVLQNKIGLGINIPVLTELRRW